MRFWVVDQKDTGLLGGVDDIVAGVPDEVAELVGAEKFPDFFHGVEFGGRTAGEVGWYSVTSGLCVSLPLDHELQVRPRSGLAVKRSITLPNSPGTVDDAYRGELQVILMKAGSEPFTIERGMRIAQAVLALEVRATWREVTELPVTTRGTVGFGSTGMK